MARTVLLSIFLAFATLDPADLKLTSSDLIKCPVIHHIRTFNSLEFSGKWYQVMIIPLPDGSRTPKCATEILTELPLGRMNLYTRVTDHDDRVYFRTGQLSPAATLTMPGRKLYPHPLSSSSKMVLLYPGDEFRHEYNVLTTDYTRYAIIYACVRIDDSLTVGKLIPKDFDLTFNRNLLNPETGQILSRSQVVEDDVMNIILAELDRLQIDFERFEPIDQVSCYNMTR